MDETDLKSTNVNNNERVIMTSEQSNENWASGFSAIAVLTRSFSIFFKHPFVFMGLSILAQVPGFVAWALMRNARVATVRTVIISAAINVVFGLATQGILANGVFEVLRGNSARLVKTLSRGMARIIPLFLAALSCLFCFVLVFFVAATLFGEPQRRWILRIAVLTLLCKWSVFAAACVVERLGPIDSLHRSSDLTKGCLLKIACLCMPCIIIIWIVHNYSTLAARAYVLFFWRTQSPVFTVFFAAMIRGLIVAVPITFFSVMTAVIYYNLRDVKEGVGIEQLTNVFD